MCELKGILEFYAVVERVVDIFLDIFIYIYIACSSWIEKRVCSTRTQRHEILRRQLTKEHSYIYMHRYVDTNIC